MTALAIGYRTAQIVALSGATPRQIDWWITNGVLSPSVQRGNGPGTQHRWSDADVRAARVVAELYRLGLTADTARLVPAAVAHADRTLERWLIVAPGRVRTCTSFELVDVLSGAEPSNYIVDLPALLHDLPNDDDAAAR